MTKERFDWGPGVCLDLALDLVGEPAKLFLDWLDAWVVSLSVVLHLAR
jgi:hypothetical protein